MSRQSIIMKFAVTMFLVLNVQGVSAKDEQNKRSPANKKRPSAHEHKMKPKYTATNVPNDCVEFLSDIIAAAGWAGSDGQPITDADRKGITFTKVYSYGTHPCAGGADDCTVSNYKGKFAQQMELESNDGFEGTFVINAGRGNCFLEKMQIDATP